MTSAVGNLTEAEHFEAIRQLLVVAPPSETIDWLNMLFYSDPGAGKTHLAGTAEDDARTSPVLFLDIEGGLTTIRNRSGIDAKTCKSLQELKDAFNNLYKSIHIDPITGRPCISYKTVVLDSGSELTDVDMRHIMKEAYGNNPDKVDIDVPSQREWGKARAHMREIVRAFRDLPCNFIMTAHVATLQEEGQPTKYFPGFAGKLRTELPGFFDIVGFLNTKVESGEVNRYLQVLGTNRVVAKDRTSSLAGTEGVLTNTTIPKMWELIHSS